MSDIPQRPDARPARRSQGLPAASRDRRPSLVRPGAAPDDPFFRHIVNSMRNGVIAFHRDGRLALMNDEAYRVFGLTPTSADVGRPFADVLRERQAVIRVLASAFEL